MANTPHPNRRRRLLMVGVAALVVLLDQWSKRWAQHALGDGSVQHVIWTLQFNLTHNSGMAFSTGAGAGRFIGLAAIVIVVVGHLYMAFRDAGALYGMGTGRVSLAWAEREHDVWAAQEVAAGAVISASPPKSPTP